MQNPTGKARAPATRGRPWAQTVAARRVAAPRKAALRMPRTTIGATPSVAFRSAASITAAVSSYGVRASPDAA
jgi:hypothetical protein